MVGLKTLPSKIQLSTFSSAETGFQVNLKHIQIKKIQIQIQILLKPQLYTLNAQLISDFNQIKV